MQCDKRYLKKNARMQTIKYLHINMFSLNVKKNDV